MNYVPFVYLITFKLTGEYYIGSHYGSCGNRIAHPSRLWTQYFTTSKIIKKLIKAHGKGAFVSKVLKIFTTKEEALAYEHRFLKRVNARENPKFLNETNGGPNFASGPMPEKQRIKISLSHINRTPEEKVETSIKKSLAQQNRSQEEKDTIANKRSVTLTGRKRSPEHQDNLTASQRNRTTEQKEQTATKVSSTRNNWSLERKTEYSLKMSASKKGKPQNKKRTMQEQT